MSVSSINSMNNMLIFSPREYLVSLGICGKNPCQVLYARVIFCSTGRSSEPGNGGGSFISFFKMKRQFVHGYNDIVSLENLFAAWSEFRIGKSSKKDVQRFAQNLIDNIVQFHAELANKSYCHGGYDNFGISDPKPRQIHKAHVRDRILHHAIYRILYPAFDTVFIADSFSCRVNKGTHKAMDRFQDMARKVSKNNTKSCWVLKCDIKKFFASIDHGILMGILEQRITDKNIIWLLRNVIDSFSIGKDGVGLPLGNLTSQLFCNVYMNEFDQFVKHELKAKYYIRYADDFVFLSDDKEWITKLIPKINKFLEDKLKLRMHPGKVYIKSFASGVDFLGWIHFPKYRRLRNTTKKRMMKRINESPTNKTLQSYLGILSHGNGHDLAEEIINDYALLYDKS
jgi:RNA-directed DNA polymerase